MSGKEALEHSELYIYLNYQLRTRRFGFSHNVSAIDKKPSVILSILVISQAFNWLVCYLLKQSEGKIQSELNSGKVMRFITFVRR